jgi:hypothetical protein
MEHELTEAQSQKVATQTKMVQIEKTNRQMTLQLVIQSQQVWVVFFLLTLSFILYCHL